VLCVLNALLCYHVSFITQSVASLGAAYKTVQISDLSGSSDLQQRKFFPYLFRTLQTSQACGPEVSIIDKFDFKRITFFYADDTLGRSWFNRLEACTKNIDGSTLRGEPLSVFPSESEFDSRNVFLKAVQATKERWSSQIDRSLEELNSRIFVLYLSKGFSVFLPLIIEKGLVGEAYFWRFMALDIFHSIEGFVGIPTNPDWGPAEFPAFWDQSVISQFAGGMLEFPDVRDREKYPEFVQFWSTLSPADFPDQMHCYLYGGCEQGGACDRTVTSESSCTDGVFYHGGLAENYVHRWLINPSYSDTDIFTGKPPNGIPEPDPVLFGEGGRAFDGMMAILVATNRLLNNGTAMADIRGDLLKHEIETMEPVPGIGGTVSFDPTTGNRLESPSITLFYRIDEDRNDNKKQGENPFITAQGGNPFITEAASYSWKASEMTWYENWRFAGNTTDVPRSLPSRCPAGQFADADWACQPCPQGSFQSEEGQEKCIPCEPGTYQDEIQQTFCEPCPMGTYTNTSGSRTCTVCPWSHFRSRVGRADCELGPCEFMDYDGSSTEAPPENATAFTHAVPLAVLFTAASASLYTYL